MCVRIVTRASARLLAGVAPAGEGASARTSARNEARMSSGCMASLRAGGPLAAGRARPEGAPGGDERRRDRDLRPRDPAYVRRAEAPAGLASPAPEVDAERGPGAHSFAVELLHLLGEVEAVFGIWCVPLLIAIRLLKGPRSAEAFLGGVDFTEPMFVFVVMAIASTRLILLFAERLMGLFASLGGGTPLSWWLSTLTVGPILGSFITEPAAMIICALLLSRRVLDLGTSPRLRYATLGLLFVNVSVGGTFTHFAAPPVLMVASKFGWDTAFMAGHFGWKAAVGIGIANAGFGLLFRPELASMPRTSAIPDGPERRVPPSITAVHLGFLALTVYAAHTPAIFVGAFLFFLAFHAATAPYQDPLDLRAPLLVAFFLAGLVVHGALQQWWIAPVLGSLQELPLFIGAMALTTVNDNAAITYLSSLVPGLGA